jgi:predicted metal-binding membrane protein
MWAVMMTVMMAPTAVPVLLVFARAGNGSNKGRNYRAALFGLGHISVWIAFSVIAALLQLTLHEAALLSPAMAITSPAVSAIVLIAIGVYQLTPLKAKCLTKCQSPIDFLLRNWKEGARGALELGIRHGVYCLGCCWALMLVLFVVGVMNIGWIAALTAFVFLEKLGPKGVRLARIAGIGIIIAGVVSLYGHA